VGAAPGKGASKEEETPGATALDAVLHGSCAPDEVTDLGEITAHARRLQRKKEELLRKHAAHQAFHSPNDLRNAIAVGTRIFVDPSLQCVLGIQEAITKLRWRQVDDRVLAQVLAVPDPARPDPKSAFVAALGGLLLVSVGFLMGNNGVAVQYQRALRLPRFLWVSPACELKFWASL
jgi:hypothetical protein